MNSKDLLFTYLEYLYSIRQSEILSEILSSKEHDSWTLDVLVMISGDEYMDLKQKLMKGGSAQNLMSLDQLLDKINVINREKRINNILDK